MIHEWGIGLAGPVGLQSEVAEIHFCNIETNKFPDRKKPLPGALS